MTKYDIKDWKGRVVSSFEGDSPSKAILHFMDLGYDFSEMRDEQFTIQSDPLISKEFMAFIIENADAIREGDLNENFGSNCHAFMTGSGICYNTHGLEQFYFKNVDDFGKWYFDEDMSVQFLYSARLGERINDDDLDVYGEIQWDNDVKNPWEIQIDPDEDGSTIWSLPMLASITDDYSKIVDSARFKFFSVMPIDGADIGTVIDRDIYFWQNGYEAGQVVAEFDMYIPQEGKTFSVAIKNEGECKIYVTFADDGTLAEYNEDDSVLLDNNTLICKEILENSQGNPLGESKLMYIAEEPYLNIGVYQNGDYIGNWYDTFGSVFGSISECLVAISPEDIQEVISSAKEDNVFAKNFDDDEISSSSLKIN